MRKICPPILLLLTLCLIWLPGTAGAVEDPCMDNPDYLYLYTAFDGENYLQCSSVVEDEYQPPRCKLEGDVIHVPRADDGKIAKRHVIFRYDSDKQLASFYDEGTWYDVDAFGHSSADKRSLTLANVLYYARYGVDFYR